MPYKLYTFGCTFNVVKRDGSKLNDMELASAVLTVLRHRLDKPDNTFWFVTGSIHPIMVGPEGGVDVE